MAYIRTITFVVPPERTYELQPGHNLFMAAVSGTQIVAQNTPGFHKGGVWMQNMPQGSIKVVSFTQWYGLSDIDHYASTPMIRDFEEDIARYHSTPVIEVFEVLS
ncbi:MAG TPA: hypothetical protein VM536_04350 [Chloroflexia bacterium]|nr:hypothetical protein [Chloroflexia bacterium]